MDRDLDLKDLSRNFLKWGQLNLNPDSLPFLPPEEMMKIIGSENRDHFVRTMIDRTQDIIERCLVTPTSSVLDIGCGCGRLAMGFSHYLSPLGKYMGFDVWPEGVDWCQKNIKNQYKNFEFFLVNADNNYYYNQCSDEANKLMLSFVDNQSIDCVFAISVFTHLIKDDAQQYFHEISRVLTAKGKVYLTFFVIDDHFHEFRKRTGKHLALKKDHSGLWHGYSGQHFFAGYEKIELENMIGQLGLKVDDYILGKWANKPGCGQTWQDLYILSKG